MPEIFFLFFLSFKELREDKLIKYDFLYFFHFGIKVVIIFEHLFFGSIDKEKRPQYK